MACKISLFLFEKLSRTCSLALKIFVSSVASILEAVKVPKTKKLLQIKVDVGIDVRTIVSGIAESFSPDQIIGQQVTVLTNLAPRTIRGVESQGMILMTETPEGKLVFVNPDDANVSNGTAPYSYAWDNGLPNIDSHTISIATNTSYNVTVTDDNGCTTTDNIDIIINPYRHIYS